MRLIAPVSSSAPCPILASSVPRDRVLQQVNRFRSERPANGLTFPKKGKVHKGRTQTKRPSANAEGLPCFNTCAYLAPDGGVFSSGSLAASDPTYLMVLRGVSIVMIASPVAVKRLMPNV